MSEGAFFFDEEPHSVAPPLLGLQLAGTGVDVESLSSYVKRSARMHRVSLNGFMMANFGPQQSGDVCISLRQDWAVRISEYLDGVNDLAGAVAEWLERSTGVAGLRYGTLVSLSRFTNGQKLIASGNRVCLDCFSDDLREGRALFERLLWKLQPVTVCDHHRRALVIPKCQVGRQRARQAPPNLPGVCRQCGSIGLACATEDGPREVTDAEIWVTRQCRQLLDAMPSLAGVDPIRMKESLRGHLLAGPGIVAASEAIGMTRSSLSTWLSSPSSTFMLFRLVDVALTQQLDLAALLRGDIVPCTGPADVSPRTPRRTMVPVNHAAVEGRLRQALELGESAAVVARELKITHCTLSQHEELYRQVVEQTRTLRNGRETQRRRLAVEEAEQMITRLLRLKKRPSLLNARIESGDRWMPSSLKASALVCIRVRLGDAGVRVPPRAALFSPELQQMLADSATRIRQQFE